MRKYGKYEKRPEGVPEKQPKVKNALLQTYFASLLCLVLCVTMFFGTSYAWFTSEVENTGNEIYIGTLDVDLRDGEGKSLAGENPIFGEGIFWEPGYTALRTLSVVNEGNLAFKYVLNFTNASDTDVPEVAQYFDVWVYDHQNNGGSPNSNDYGEITEANGWEPVGTLADVLGGKAVFAGSMTAEDVVDQTSTEVKETTHTYTIALHMKEDAKNITDEQGNHSLMGKTIALNVKLTAYQMGSENDGFNNSDYDNVRFVSTDKELQEALDNATGNVIIQLAKDITGDVTATQKEGVTITVDGNGHKFNGVITVNGQSSRYESAALTIKNVNFHGQVKGADAYIKLGGNDSIRYTNHVTVQNCTFTGTDKEVVAVKSYTGGDWNLTIDGCTVNDGMHSLAQLKNVEKNLIVTKCEVYSKNGLNVNNGNNLTMSDCTFDVQGYAVRFGSDDNATDESFTIKNCTLKSFCAEAGDAVIEFRAGAVNATLTLTNTTVEGTLKVKGNTTDTTITGLN